MPCAMQIRKHQEQIGLLQWLKLRASLLGISWISQSETTAAHEPPQFKPRAKSYNVVTTSYRLCHNHQLKRWFHSFRFFEWCLCPFSLQKDLNNSIPAGVSSSCQIISVETPCVSILCFCPGRFKSQIKLWRRITNEIFVKFPRENTMYILYNKSLDEKNIVTSFFAWIANHDKTYFVGRSLKHTKNETLTTKKRKRQTTKFPFLVDTFTGIVRKGQYIASYRSTTYVHHRYLFWWRPSELAEPVVY